MGSEESSAPVKYDSLFAEIARDAVSGGQISTSMIQRNYEVGFNRAGRIMMQLERAGIVGRQQGANRATSSTTTCLRWRRNCRNWDCFKSSA